MNWFRASAIGVAVGTILGVLLLPANAFGENTYLECSERHKKNPPKTFAFIDGKKMVAQVDGYGSVPMENRNTYYTGSLISKRESVTFILGRIDLSLFVFSKDLAAKFKKKAFWRRKSVVFDCKIVQPQL